MRLYPRLTRLALGFLLCAGAACSASSDGVQNDGENQGGGLAPSGAQDFGRFKELLKTGILPGPETLDQVGFFAEHKIGDPPTNCADPVCGAASLGSMANMISGSNCTLVQLQLGSSLDPKTVPRPALDVAVVSDGTMGSDVRQGLRSFLAGLSPGDTVSVIAQSGLSAERLPVGDPALPAHLDAAAAGSGLPLYDGLRLSIDTLGPYAPARQRRVLLLSSTPRIATSQVSTDRAVRLLSAFAQTGGSLSLISLGNLSGPGQKTLQQLADAAVGNLYYAATGSELQDILGRELAYGLIPIASQVSVQIKPGSPYLLREVFGLSRPSWNLSAEGGHLDIPALYVAWRKAAMGGQGRRGGGGGILIEVLPKRGANPRERPSKVADLQLEYTVPATLERKQLALSVVSPDGPGEVPSEGRFSSADVEKGFVVLNLYVALRMASERAAVSDLSSALSVLSSVERAVTRWLTSRFDPEIADDLNYVRLFIDLLVKKGAEKQPPRSGWFNEPWPRD